MYVQDFVGEEDLGEVDGRRSGGTWKESLDTCERVMSVGALRERRLWVSEEEEEVRG